jgi:hypothetical protein
VLVAGRAYQPEPLQVISCCFPSIHNKLSLNVSVFSSNTMTYFGFKNPSSHLYSPLHIGTLQMDTG